MTSAPVQGKVAARIVVRFKDDEVLEGFAPAIDLDEPDFKLALADAKRNGGIAIVPVASVKSILLQRVELESSLDRVHMPKVAIHFWDGEALHGLLGSEPERRRYGITLPLVSPALDEIEVLGIPYAAVKAIHITSAWNDQSPLDAVLEQGRWPVPRIDAPLLALLGEIRRLAAMRSTGDITAEDFERRRREVLSRI